jgi:phage baseplate assembly protein W
MAVITQSNSSSQLTRYFLGYSTLYSNITGVRSLYDIDLINIDLMTSFNTRVGERVMRPDYGCKLWDMLFEPMTPILAGAIIAEATRICNLDARVVPQTITPLQIDKGFRIEATLLYLPWNVIATFSANFELSETTYFNQS